MNTAQLCATNRIALNATFAILDSATLLYTYISRFSVNPNYISRGKNSGKVSAINFIPNRFLSHFSTSRTNAPRSLSRVKAGTHSPSLKGSHTAAYTPKQGRFGRGWYHYPRTVPHVSETLCGRGSKRQTLPLWGLGQGCSQRTQKACGAAMRLCTGSCTDYLASRIAVRDRAVCIYLEE